MCAATEMLQEIPSIMSTKTQELFTYV